MDQKRTDYFKVGAKQYKEIRNEYKDGKLIFDGDIDEAIDRYEKTFIFLFC